MFRKFFDKIRKNMELNYRMWQIEKLTLTFMIRYMNVRRGDSSVNN